MFELVIDDPCDLFRDAAKKAREHLDKVTVDASDNAAWAGWIEPVYAARGDSLEAATLAFDPYVLDSIAAAFYQAESFLLSGRRDRASELYSDITRRIAPAWDYTWQMLSCTRLAEIAAASGDYAGAVELQKQALDFYQNEYRVDWMIEGRRQYFERLGSGEAHAPAPTLLSAAPSAR